MSKLLIVIPAHNEEANIVQVVEELTRGYPQYDYVVVNDGSRDKTAALCRAHGYRLIDLPVNLGLAGAFQTGLRFAAENGYDCAMQMDADGQHKPEYIAPMLAALEEGNDIVIGSRFLTVKKPKTLRMLGSYIISWSIRLTTGRAICDPTSGMRMFNRAGVEEFAQNLNYGTGEETSRTLTVDANTTIGLIGSNDEVLYADIEGKELLSVVEPGTEDVTVYALPDTSDKGVSAG